MFELVLLYSLSQKICDYLACFIHTAYFQAHGWRYTKYSITRNTSPLAKIIGDITNPQSMSVEAEPVVD